MIKRKVYAIIDQRLFEYGYVEGFEKLLKNYNIQFLDVHENEIPDFNNFDEFGNVLTIYLNEVFFPLNDFTIETLEDINPRKYMTIVFALNMDMDCLSKLQEINSEFYIDKEKFINEYSMLYETYFTHILTKFDMILGG